MNVAPVSRGLAQTFDGDVADHDAANAALVAPKNQTLKVLSREDANFLALCETVIEKGLATFIEVGKALQAIRDQRLYREQHGTFANYCEQRWNFGASRARQLIASVEIVANLKNVTTVTLSNEAQARQLASLSPSEQRKAWQNVVDTAPRNEEGKPKVTASHVRDIAQRRQRNASNVPALPTTPNQAGTPATTRSAIDTAPTVSSAIEVVVNAIRDDGDVQAVARSALSVLKRRRMGTSPETLANALAALLNAIAEVAP